MRRDDKGLVLLIQGGATKLQLKIKGISNMSNCKHALVSFIVWAFYRILISTWRIEIIESESVKKLKANNRSWVIAMWHGDEIAIINFCRFYKVATLTSTSRDGELINQILLRLGMKTSRGSSTRGGSTALKGLIRLTRNGFCPVVPVDGPKGPLHQVKPGVFELAKVVRSPIIPVGVACSRKFIFQKSWNKAYIPLPFSRVLLVWGEEFRVPDDADPRNVELAKNLKQQLDAMSRMALKLFAKN